MFVAPRIVWLPDRVEADLGIGANQLLLSQWGMDIGLWDDVRARDRLPIGADERECFYALLECGGTSRRGGAGPPGETGPLSWLPAAHPEQEHGNIFQVTGRLRRITRVVVDEPDIRQRFGMAAYYQLDVMVPVGDQPIEVRGEQRGAGWPGLPRILSRHVLHGPTPGVLGIARRTPANVNRPVLMHGVFYKLWAYSNPLVAAYDPRQRQLSPMFVVAAPQAWDPSSRPGRGSWSASARRIVGPCGLPGS